MKLNELTAGTAANLTDLLYALQGSTDANVTLQQVYDLVVATLATAPLGVHADTVANLTALSGVTAGAIAYATDGRKSGEGAGAGTGCPVYYSGGWKAFSSDAAVTA
jgi:hypothetical protein